MSLRDSQQTGRLRLRHLLEVTEAVGEEMEIERERFARLAERETRAVSAFNLFQTPPELAARLAGMLPLTGRILEPSAGLGRLYRAVRAVSDCHVTLVEVSPQCAAELYRETAHDDAARLIQADFLECDADRLGGTFDGIIMNPPFQRGMDIRHIEHARRMLAPGGTLVALCADGPRQRRHFDGCDYTPLPPRSFASEGTSVAAAIVTLPAA